VAREAGMTTSQNTYRRADANSKTVSNVHQLQLASIDGRTGANNYFKSAIVMII
jgi:hypothetical protein